MCIKDAFKPKNTLMISPVVMIRFNESPASLACNYPIALCSAGSLPCLSSNSILNAEFWPLQATGEPAFHAQFSVSNYTGGHALQIVIGVLERPGVVSSNHFWSFCDPGNLALHAVFCLFEIPGSRLCQPSLGFLRYRGVGSHTELGDIGEDANTSVLASYYHKTQVRDLYLNVLSYTFECATENNHRKA